MIRFTATGHVACPACEHGALKTDADLKRGYCDGCYMLKHNGLRIGREKHQAKLAEFRLAFPVVAAAGEELTFRSEADAYRDDIYDRD